MMVRLDPGIRRPRATLREYGAGTDVMERRANPSEPALGARMTFVARPHTPSKYTLNTRYAQPTVHTTGCRPSTPLEIPDGPIRDLEIRVVAALPKRVL